MDANSKNYKLELLKDALGDLSQYHSSKWYWHQGETEQEWRHEGLINIYPRPTFTPIVKKKCYCKTPIINHYMILNQAGEKFFIGSECNKRFRGHLKRCLKCNEPYRGKFRYCKDCRESGGFDYHSDPRVIQFGKYKDKTIDYVSKVNKGYLKWMRDLDMVKVRYPRQLIAINLLLNPDK